MHPHTKESRHPSHTWGDEALTSWSHTGVKANTMDLYSVRITWSLIKSNTGAQQTFGSSDTWWIFDLITPTNSMRRKNLIIHFQRASTRVHICNRPVNLCHSIREISAVFNPVWRDGKAATPAAIYTSRSSARTTPMSHFMQCCIIREKEDRVMFTYSHLWWVQENWIHAESGIIDLDSSRARNIWGLSHTGTPSDDIIKEGWTARHSHLHQYLPVNTFTFGIKIFPNETN